MSGLTSRDQIKQQAIEAANRGEGPDACPYVVGTEQEREWKDAFYIRLYFLSGEKTA